MPDRPPSTPLVDSPSADGQQSVPPMLSADLQNLRARIDELEQENQSLKGRVRELEAQNGACGHCDEGREERESAPKLDAMHEFFCMLSLSITLALPFEQRTEVDNDVLYTEACQNGVPMWEWHTWLSSRLRVLPIEPGQNGQHPPLPKMMSHLGSWVCSGGGRCPTSAQSARRTLGLDDSALPPVQPVGALGTQSQSHSGDYIVYSRPDTDVAYDGTQVDEITDAEAYHSAVLLDHEQQASTPTAPSLL